MATYEIEILVRVRNIDTYKKEVNFELHENAPADRDPYEYLKERLVAQFDAIDDERSKQ